MFRTTTKKYLHSVLFFALIIFCYSNSYSQSLIQNGGFEDYIGCPSDPIGYGHLDSATHWSNPAPYWEFPNPSSPDFFHSCSENGYSSIPNNYYGHQYAYEGQGCGGIALYDYYPFSDWNYREYIQNELVSPMIANECYRFEMYVNIVDSSQYLIPEVQIYFSEQSIYNVNNTMPLSFSPQLTLSGIQYDTTNWQLLYGEIIANGNEKFLTIGNFKTDSISTPFNVNPSAEWTISVILIDNVSLFPCNQLSVGNSVKDIIEIYPNPTNSELHIKNLDKVNGIEICTISSIDGTFIKDIDIGSSTIKISDIPCGIYVLNIQHKDGLIKQRFIKN